MADALAAKPALGVLFVHGIGDQGRGETLLWCGEPLKDTIEAWLKIEGSASAATLTGTKLVDTAEAPAHTRLRIEVGGAKSEWLLAECWWARSFIPARFSELTSWVLVVVPWILNRFVMRGAWWPVLVLFLHLGSAVTELFQSLISKLKSGPKKSPNDVRSQLEGSAVMWAAWLVSLMVTVGIVYFILIALGPVTLVVVAVILGVLIAASLSAVVVQLATLLLIPIAWIPPLAGIASAIQVRMASSLGDSYVFLRSDVRSDAIVTRVQEDIQWLIEKGCDAVVLIAHSQGAAVAHRALETYAPAQVRLLVTYGAGIAKLAAVQEAMIRPFPIVLGNVLQMLGLGIIVFTGWGMLAAEPASMWNAIQTFHSTAQLALGLLGFGVLVFIVGIATGADVAPSALPNALALRGGATGVRWMDFCATDDPVPDGPIPTTSTVICNYRSMFRDHGAYWSNRDQFVLPLALELADLADMSIADPAERELIHNVTRRSRPRRTSALLLARMSAYAALPGAVLLALNDHTLRSRLAQLGDLLATIALSPISALTGQALVAAPIVAIAIGLAAGALVMMAAFELILVAAWRWWDRLASTATCQRPMDVGAERPGQSVFAVAAATTIGMTGALYGWLAVAPPAMFNGLIAGELGPYAVLAVLIVVVIATATTLSMLVWLIRSARLVIPRSTPSPVGAAVSPR